MNVGLGNASYLAQPAGAAFQADVVASWPAHNRERMTVELFTREQVAAAVAAERERWRKAAEYAEHQLGKARVWNGTEWRYNPLHPLHYRSALERLRDVLS